MIFTLHGNNAVVEWEFLLLDNMFCALLADLRITLPVKNSLLGTFVPGHSFKGKQIPLIGDEELSKRASQKTRD